MKNQRGAVNQWLTITITRVVVQKLPWWKIITEAPTSHKFRQIRQELKNCFRNKAG